MGIFGRNVLIGLVAGMAGLVSSQVQAQPYSGPGAVFVCKSSSYQQNYCGADTRFGVTMTRQISNSACVQGRTWGFDRRGVWVTQGCEAEFMLGRPMAGPPPMRGGPPMANLVRCESHDYEQNYCRADTRGGVRMQRQISSSACIRGRTWGANGGGIWVSDGCSGDFAVGGGWDPGMAPMQWSDFVPEHVVRCESYQNRQVKCEANTRGGVQLRAQLSNAPCVRGQSWGFDRGGIWVAGNCRADFQVGGFYR
ncbi:MAG TPA: DUF3011 domain-containing protein [Xanthomonadaceae bacterium]|jgi:hypothetical protein